jgi:FkbM family methyltransferase
MISLESPPHPAASRPLAPGDAGRRPRVIFWDNLPAPYAVERYNLLADRGTLDFSVWFSRRTDPDRRWDVDESTWRFEGTYIEDPSENLASLHRFARRCDEVRPDLVVSLYGERPFVAGHLVMKGLGIATALVVERTFDTWVRRAWWKEAAKAVLFRSAAAAQVHAPPMSADAPDQADGFGYAYRYGFTRERTFGVTHSIDVARYAAPVSREARSQVRERLGADGCLFLYVGRYWRGKGLDVLLNAFAQARHSDPRISLLTIGNGEEEEALRVAAQQVAGVTVWPFVPARDLLEAYAAADVFVFPSLGDPFGLVIEEAHAAGLPVITTDTVGDVRHRVADGTSGFVVASGSAAALADRMVRLAADRDLRSSMGARGAARVQTWDHERWASDFERFVTNAVRLAPRETMASRVITLAGRALVHAADVVARARVFGRKVAARGVLATSVATSVARGNRLGMRLASLPWHFRRPRLAVRQFGTAHGGWALPVDHLTPGGVCYCVGVGEDTSLEDDLLRRTDCSVWSFDPTPRSIAHVETQPFDPARFRFLPVGIWDKTETVRFFQHTNPAFESHSPVNIWKTAAYFDAPCTTVAALMREFKHDRLALLKVDTEGGEWRVLPNILDEAPGVGILCVLFCQPAPFWRIASMVRRLGRHGYRYVCHDQWKFTFVRQERPKVTSPADQREEGR